LTEVDRDTCGHRRKGSVEALIVGLAEGRTFQEAAALAGISEKTARRRACDPQVVTAVEKHRALVLERASAQLLDRLDQGIATLSALLDSESESTRLKAVALLFDKALSLRETQSFEHRLAAVEELAQQEEDRGDPDLSGWSP
jgi:F420-0:gamma-glutamyl ligase